MAWLLRSPSLFDQTLCGYAPYQHGLTTQETDSWLQEFDHHIDHHPEDVSHILRSSHRRLGLYCEALLSFFFENIPTMEHGDFDQVIRNFQLFSSEPHRKTSHRKTSHRKTIGECDFLLAKKQNPLIHIELAVKFYLQLNHEHDDWSNWIGPNAVDRLDIKLDRMLTHQLALPHIPETQEVFKKLTLETESSDEIQSQHIIKGMLFFPSKANTQTLPKSVNRHAPTGIWMTLSEFENHLIHSDNTFYVCDKMEWLTGPVGIEKSWATAQDIGVKLSELIRRAKKDARRFSGILILENQGSKSILTIMVVDDHWPETSLPLRRI